MPTCVISSQLVAANRVVLPMAAGILAAVLLVFIASASGKATSVNEFLNHGVASAVAEFRGHFVMETDDGQSLILVLIQDQYRGRPRNSLLLIDADTGETEQFWYEQNGDYAGDLFGQLLAKTGKLYVMFGDTFLEFDPVVRDWTFAQRIGGLAMSFAESVSGNIYVATYPQSLLYEFDPTTRTLTPHGQLDTTEQYPYYLAVDDHGWVYAGIGTSRSNLVAYNPQTGVRTDLAAAEQRQIGSGEVYLATDGFVYGRPVRGEPWYRLVDGRRQSVEAPAPQAPGGGIRWGPSGTTWPVTFPSGREIVYFDIGMGRVGMTGKGRGVHVLDFDYETSGTIITSLVAGPDGRVYGSTAHPMHWFAYDPATDTLDDMGGLEKVGGGNFPNFTVVGDNVVGAAYVDGLLYALNTDKPWNPSSLTHENPVLLTEFGDPLSRPRAIITYPDSDKVVVGGFAGYGHVGGGIGVYDLATHEEVFFPATDILPGHSTIALQVLPGGELIGGTSIEAPGGGHPTATEAQLFIMDWPSGDILFSVEPIPGHTVFGHRLAGAREILSLEVGPGGLVYGMATGTEFFVFDPQAREVIYRNPLNGFGRPLRPGQTLFTGPEGHVYALLDATLLKFDPDTFAATVVTTLPKKATAGIALLDGRLYYVADTELHSMRLAP